MAFFCSEEMELYLLLLHVDNAFNCLMELGHHGGLQFNNVYEEDHILNGFYTKKVQLCHELLRIVEYLQDQLSSLDMRETYYADVDTEHRPHESYIPAYELSLRRQHTEVVSVMEHFNTLEKRQNYLQEKRFALQKASKFLSSDGNSGSQLLYSESTIVGLLKDQSEADPHGLQLNYILGTINVEKFPAFELMLYRIFGRNLLIRHAEIPMKIMEQVGHQRQMVHKHVILLMTTSTSIRPKLMKCCHAFHVTIFECPEKPSQRAQMIAQLDQDIRDLDVVLNETLAVRQRILSTAATDLYIIRINLRKSIRVYDLLNRLYPVGGPENQRYLQAECFVPKSQVNGVRDALNRGMFVKHGEELISSPPILLRRTRKQRHMPPTYFRLNKFTHGFQNLIDSYGIADYRELNPAPYTIITFPFLFAIMFGDLGHGIILTFFACALIYQEKSIEEFKRTNLNDNEILNILYAGRYIVLLMGLFSIYIGLIYNDVVSRPMNLFGSSWSCVYNETTIMTLTTNLAFNPNDPKFYTGHPYPFGVDPVWSISGEDSITTFNSLKMKLAIILGITQMMFGLTLSAVNCIHLHRKADLFLVVFPIFVFMICLFCYLVFLIFFKWLMYGGLKQAPYNSACAPSVLITFIDMMLMKTTALEVKSCNVGMFPYERLLEYILVFVAFASVPVLLAGKPIYLTRRQKQLTKEIANQEPDMHKNSHNTIQEMRSSLRYSVEFQNEDNRGSGPKLHTVDDALEFDMTEIWIHSGIHTIESVLGSVSHTASYLRLWALSLAHSQLSDVLWNMILEKGLKNKLPIYVAVPILVVAFFIWAILTVAILVMMEGLSAFLHTLRLHWVEFQSKFFNGAGEPFRSFYFPPSTIRG
ncbi:V-type proton ATPase 116 kDa subunit a 1 [Drosophila virilis]|uniref:V-type proton ATPase subunit a n=1 Tax=Drosophila virilis TaxID=7244 RepID=B4LN22_DROVI|nr:V-type proton ATPase 116 kDa subunit a [Drosophila virilis]EDW62137.1 uncharacterized protein Dvir_GJ22427 [Drosophila virilis]